MQEKLASRIRDFMNEQLVRPQAPAEAEATSGNQLKLAKVRMIHKSKSKSRSMQMMMLRSDGEEFLDFFGSSHFYI